MKKVGICWNDEVYGMMGEECESLEELIEVIERNGIKECKVSVCGDDE